MAQKDARCRSHGEAGFTLIETLVVMGVLAAMLAVVPMVFAGLPAMRLRAAADGMADILRGLHDGAVRRGSAQALFLDVAARTYTTTLDPVPRPLPDVVDRVQAQHQSWVLTNVTVQVRFFPDGSATGSTITFHHGDRRETVTVHWLTGQVRRNG